jgi:hypothetical protein
MSGHWSEALHPRNPVGRFVDVGDDVEFRPTGEGYDRRFRMIQQARLGRGFSGVGAEDVTFVDNPRNTYTYEFLTGSKVKRSGLEKIVLDDYAEGSATINGMLRTGASLDGDYVNPDNDRGSPEISTRDYIEVLDGAIAQAALTDDLTVVRKYETGAIPDLKPGDQIVDWGYMSTTTDPMHDNVGVFGANTLEISLPAGTPVALPGRHHHSKSMLAYREVLVGRGAVLQVLEVGEGMNGAHTKLRLVGFVEDQP